MCSSDLKPVSYDEPKGFAPAGRSFRTTSSFSATADYGTPADTTLAATPVADFEPIPEPIAEVEEDVEPAPKSEPPEAASTTVSEPTPDDDLLPANIDATPSTTTPSFAASTDLPPPLADEPADEPVAETRPSPSNASRFAPSQPPFAPPAPAASVSPSAFAAPAVPVPPPQPSPTSTPRQASPPPAFGPESFSGLGPPATPAATAPAARPVAPAGLQATPESGQGRPGPSRLEGVQAPQLTVEKRGPREVQVGKPARYELLIRNVGTAAAHDVTLHDAVPAGTRLIATTPPAAPGAGNTGDLVWSLGTLEPSAGTKVAMEVMPETEGEIGSVASVTFRADASVRSRSTKPAIFVEASTPKPVLVGDTITVSLVVSNPGTGPATGVVLVGTLPEGVTHPAGKELEFDVGQLKPAERRTIDLKLASASPGVHAMTVAARGDGQLMAEAAVPLEVTAPMLELAAEMPARRYLQRPATCLITMANTGTAPAKAVELATQLPQGMKFVRANNSGFYDERHHRVLWSLEELPAGESGTVELVVMPVSLGPQKFVTAARNPAGLSDQIGNTIEVEGLASLSFQITDSEDPIEVDGLTEYVIRVGNQGTMPASGVRVAATLLGDLEPVEAKGPAAHRVENLTVIFEPLAKLVPTEEATYRVRVRGRRAGDHRVQVQVTSDDHAAPITKEEVTRVYADR